MGGHYQKLGIEFLYPENWIVTDEETQTWPRSVSVQNAEGSFWSLMVYDDADPAALTEEVLSAMQAEYDDLEKEEVVEEFADFAATGYDMCFCCLDFVVNARALSVRAANQTYLLVWQAEDREFQQLIPVFRAISTSLFNNVASAIRAGS